MSDEPTLPPFNDKDYAKLDVQFRELEARGNSLLPTLGLTVAQRAIELLKWYVAPSLAAVFAVLGIFGLTLNGAYREAREAKKTIVKTKIQVEKDGRDSGAALKKTIAAMQQAEKASEEAETAKSKAQSTAAAAAGDLKLSSVAQSTIRDEVIRVLTAAVDANGGLTRLDNVKVQPMPVDANEKRGWLYIGPVRPKLPNQLQSSTVLTEDNKNPQMVGENQKVKVSATMNLRRDSPSELGPAEIVGFAPRESIVRVEKVRRVHSSQGPEEIWALVDLNEQ